MSMDLPAAPPGADADSYLAGPAAAWFAFAMTIAL